jgi:ribosomal protein S18 acetylase RimI-like enzyme
LRRGHGSDWPAVLAVDAVAFPAFWRLDVSGLREALDATPVTRFRVAAHRRGGDNVLAYSVTGLSGNQGYLQRLAVHPDHRRMGLGRALGLDGLRWLRRKAVREAVVNTQLGNDAALALYLSLGFRKEPTQLSVLHRRLG